MELLSQIIVGAALCIAVAAIICAVRNFILTPVRKRADVDIVAVVRARGGAEGLEQSLKGIQWLRDSGKADLELVIADCGMDTEALRRAEVLALKNGVEILSPKRLTEKTEEFRWRNLES